MIPRRSEDTPSMPPASPVSTSPPPPVASTTSFPPAGMGGVPQPAVSTKEVFIILFMFLFWAYSIHLTYRAWYKLLYSDGDEHRDNNMWRLFLDAVRKKRNTSEGDPDPEQLSEEEEELPQILQ